MPSTSPRVTVRTAERSGSPDKPSEDRIFTTDNAVIVLDGASQPEQTERNGGWLAEQLGSTLAARLGAHPAEDLAEALAWSIATVADTHGLMPGESPSTTVTIARWTDSTVNVLVLCDSPAIVVTTDGETHLLNDDRLARVTSGLRCQPGYSTDNPSNWRELVAGQRQKRNRPDGYWVAEADPTASRHAIQAAWRIGDVSAVLAMTDGVSIGVQRYKCPADWKTAARIAMENPADLIELIHAAEDTDLTGARWLRSKVHDDKALAVAKLRHR